MAELDKKTLNEAEIEVVTGGTQSEDISRDTDDNEIVKDSSTSTGKGKKNPFERRL